MAIDGLADIIKGAVDAAQEDDETIVDGTEGDGTEFVPASEDEAEHGDGEGETVVEEPAVVEPVAKVEEAVVETKVEKPVDDGEDAFAKEHGIKSKDKSGRENRIPYSAVVRINKNAVANAEKTWKAANIAAVAERDARITHYEDRFKKVGQTEEVMFGNPGQFLGMLLKIPGYKEVLGDVKLDAHGFVTGVGAAAPAGPVVDANDPEPLPDVDLGNGQTGYSAEQFKKLRAYDKRQSVREAAAAARADFDKDFKPVKDLFDKGQTSRAQQTAIDNEIAAAMTWPGFEANYAAILKAMDDDYREQQPAITAGRTASFKFKNMKDAYDHVMYGLVQAKTETQAQMETRIRKEVQESLRRAPRSTQAGAGAVAAVAGRGEEPPSSGNATADIIRAQLKAK